MVALVRTTAISCKTPGGNSARLKGFELKYSGISRTNVAFSRWIRVGTDKKALMDWLVVLGVMATGSSRILNL